MYTIVISAPFRRIDAYTCEVASDWGASLVHLRDSLGGYFGPLMVAAPECGPGDAGIGDQVPVRLHARKDEIAFTCLGRSNWRARDFWRHYRGIRSTCDELARQSAVVHSGINDIWQPYSLLGFNAACRAGRTTVFVLDGDAIERIRDLASAKLGRLTLRDHLYCRTYFCLARSAVRRADLSLLKGQALQSRYGRFARRAMNFYNTSYRATDIICGSELDRKCAEVAAGAPVRCVALGRLIDFKGVDHTIRAVLESVRAGANLSLDIIGQGPDEPRLRELVDQAGAGGIVRFLGSRPYGGTLLRELTTYHVLLFTSCAEETPRSLFDGIAAGCALLAYDITYTREVTGLVGHGTVVPKGDVRGISRCLLDLHRERRGLERLMRAAARSAPEHAAEVWYRRRAEWTIEAHAQRIGKRPR